MVEPMMLPSLVAVCGRKRSGKDTLGAYLVEEHGYKRVAFADKLKEGVCTLNPVLYSLPGDVVVHLDDLRMRGESDVELCDRLKDDIPEVRRLLRAFAHETMQVLFGLESFWVDLVLNGWDGGRTVITDMRYPHEEKPVHAAGGCVLRVTRPGLVKDDSHASETSVDQVNADIDIVNDGTVEQYYSKALCALTAWEAG